MKRIFGGLFWLLVSLAILFTGLALIAHYAPSPVSTVARKAAALATPRG